MAAASRAKRSAKSGPNLKDEVRSYFANGRHVPGTLSHALHGDPQAWDRVAEAAKWARAVMPDVLRDVHWTGGDPLHLQVYRAAMPHGARGKAP